MRRNEVLAIRAPILFAYVRKPGWPRGSAALKKPSLDCLKIPNGRVALLRGPCCMRFEAGLVHQIMHASHAFPQSTKQAAIRQLSGFQGASRLRPSECLQGNCQTDVVLCNRFDAVAYRPAAA